MEVELNTDTIDKDPQLFSSALKAWDRGDVVGVMCFMSNGKHMAFIADNWPLLKKAGKYEETLLYANSSIRTNYAFWNMDVLKFLFGQADIQILRKLGDPIPDQETFTLFRGVSGIGCKRRVNGFSWTDNPNLAAWFAKRFNLQDPAVFIITVPNKCIMAFDNGRNEREFLLRLPLPVKPKRLKIMPEAIIDRKNYRI